MQKVGSRLEPTFFYSGNLQKFLTAQKYGIFTA